VTRALVVSRHPYPMQTTLRRNVAELLAQGIGVDVVCLSPRLAWGATVAGSPGLRVYGVPFKQRRSHPLRYALNYAGFFIWAVLVVSVLAARSRYEVVEVENTPDFLIFTTVVPRLRHQRIVLFSMELMPELTAARLGASRRDWPVRVATWLEGAAFAWADHVITVSDPCRRILLGRGLPPDKVTVIPNSHRTADLPPARPADPPFLVIQTTLIERYGVHVAIRALAALQADFPNLTLVILGQGEAESRLIDLTRDLGLSDKVAFSHGYLPWPDMIAQVSRATLGLVPILADGYGELVLPNKVLEFAALGIPAVCSRLPAIEAHFPPDALAYFEPGDAAGLAAQVRRLLTNQEEARSQARRAQGVMRDLAWESVSPRYLKALGVPQGAPAPIREPGRVPAI
jgi:glycosyltransferase involved in cell wall biosynthesis